MAAPVRADIKYYRGENSAPINNSDPIGGAIYTTTELDQDTSSNLWANVSISSDSDLIYYSIHYRAAKNETSGSLQNARIYNRAGAILNTGSGIATITSTSGTEDIDIRVTGKVSGAWTSETISISGTTPALGVQTWDTGTVVRWEAVSGTPQGNLSCSIASELVGVMYGTNDDPVDGDDTSISSYMISAETTWALADAINTTVESTNRITEPDDIGTFSEATYWTGEDGSINIPGGALEIDDYIGVVGKLTLLEDVPQPMRNFMVMIVVLGDSVG